MIADRHWVMPSRSVDIVMAEFQAQQATLALDAAPEP
jgi:hypothetical protein